MGEPVVELLGPSAGGIRRHVASLARGLRERGWTPIVAGPAGVMDGISPQYATVPIPTGLSLRAARRARGALAPLAGRCSVVHAHGLKAGLIASTIRSRPPLVTTVHTLVLDESAGRLAAVLRRFEALLPRRSDRVIAVSQQIADRFAGVAGAERIVVIAPASDPPAAVRSRAEVRASLGVDLEVPLVVCVARLHPQKDLPTFLRAVRHMQAQVPAVRAAIVGEGPDEAAVRALVDELGLAEVVVLAGLSPNAADEMAAADVVALSSRWEGNPLTLAEAMQLEVPVVATSVGAVPTLVEDGVTGRLVQPGDPAALAAACADLLGERAVARALAAAGRRRANDLLGREALVDAVDEVYREVGGS